MMLLVLAMCSLCRSAFAYAAILVAAIMRCVSNLLPDSRMIDRYRTRGGRNIFGTFSSPIYSRSSSCTKLTFYVDTSPVEVLPS